MDTTSENQAATVRHQEGLPLRVFRRAPSIRSSRTHRPGALKSSPKLSSPGPTARYEFVFCYLIKRTSTNFRSCRRRTLFHRQVCR
jgi:hypothetical protein